MSPVDVVKYGHACVRLVKDGRSVVIDPGEFTREADAIAGAEAVLVTHEHPDHVDLDRLRHALANDPDLAVYTCAGVARLLADPGDRVRVLHESDEVEVAGFRIRAVGGRHHISHPDTPPVDNLGFLVDDAIHYTGDAPRSRRRPHDARHR